MIIMVCLDDKGGMMFNRRRQSRDRVVRERMVQMAGGRGLWMNHYSAGQFAQDDPAALRVDDDFLQKAGEGDFCFVENEALAPWEADLEKLVLFRWNRVYPADRYFDLDLTQGRWSLEDQEEFVGSSHEKITMEVYTR